MIAIICPVHTNPRVAAAQIQNYASDHGDQAVHFLHPSIEGGVDFSQLSTDKNLNCEVVICDDQWQTHYRCTIGAALSATQMIKDSGTKFSHVYYHSDADLLISPGFVNTIKSNNNGYATRSIDNMKLKKKREYGDERFRAIRKELGLADSDIRVGRIEGCFFEIDVWNEMIALTNKYYSREYLAKNSHWPLEAGLFPTMARKLLNQERPSTRHLVRTKFVKPVNAGDHARHVEESKIQVEDIIQERGNNKQNLCVALKWFSTNLDHPARKFLAETLHA